jgi:hypothetical protein
LPNRRSRAAPKQPTELDDSLLTASEVAHLKLNADRCCRPATAIFAWTTLARDTNLEQIRVFVRVS